MDIRKTRIFGIGGLRISLIDKKVSEISFSGQSVGEESDPPDETRGIRRQLEEYFAGRRKEFEADLVPRGTDFQKAVWKAIREIPYGETRSYAEIAERIGKPRAYRAVGQAASKNPIAILIPCHRVVGSDGSLTGYAGGADLKTRLLELERRFK